MRNVPLSFARGATLALLLLTLLPAPARAEPPVTTIGVAAAWNCLGSIEEVPLPFFVCSFARDGAGGPYARPYVSVRPIDRLLLTGTLGYVTAARQEWPLCCPLSGSRPLGVTVQDGRTAWHGQVTGAYVTGAPTHPVRAFIGSGVTIFRDAIVTHVRPTNGPETRQEQRAPGVAGLFTTGALIRVNDRVEARATYTLAQRMAASNRPDTAWRHEFGVGIGWHVGG